VTGRSILVVEDDPGVSSLIRWALEEEGHQVVVATTGPEALEAVERQIPALILLDFGLPLLDGGAVARELRARGHDLPIVLLTADTRIGEKAVATGAIATLAKPFELDDLSAVVAAHLP